MELYFPLTAVRTYDRYQQLLVVMTSLILLPSDIFSKTSPIRSNIFYQKVITHLISRTYNVVIKAQNNKYFVFIVCYKQPIEVSVAYFLASLNSDDQS